MPTKKAMRSYLQMLARFDRSQGQQSLAALLLREGSWFHGRANSEEYEITRAWQKEHRPRAKECYFNAQQFCLDHSEGRYFEGYVLLEGGMAAEHAWVVLPEADGKVIDFTFEAMKRKAKRERLSYDTKDALYLGVEVPRKFVRDVMLREQAAVPVAELFFEWRASSPHAAADRHSLRQGRRTGLTGTAAARPR